MIYSLVLISTLFTFSISATASQSPGFDVNDISVLFPLHREQAYPAIDLGTHPELLSNEILSEVLKFEFPDKNLLDLPYPNMEILARRERWKLTSFRLDGCSDTFKHLDIPNTSFFELSQNGSQCQPRLRLILQPFNGFGQPLVSALHLNYRLSADEFKQSIVALQKLRDESRKLYTNTAGQPLAIHPGLAAEIQTLQNQNSGALATVLSQFIKNVPNVSSLELVTMTLSTDSRHWKFVGGYVKDGHWIRFVTRLSRSLYASDLSADLGVEELVCNFYEICHSSPQYSQMSMQLLTRIFRPDFAKRPELERKVSETLILAEAVDSTRNHFFSTNCISCHESSNYRNREQLLLETTSQEQPAGITPYTWGKYVSELPSAVINFGYDGTHPRVSTRTAAESTHVADQINRSLGFANPGYTPKDHSAFWQCLMASNSECFTK